MAVFLWPSGRRCQKKQINQETKMKKASVNKILNVRTWSMGLAIAVLFLRHDARGESTTLNLNFKLDMTNPAVEPAARGTVEATSTLHGSDTSQRIEIRLNRLNTGAPYHLVALIGDDTNAINIAAFTTDRKGAFEFIYVKKGEKPPGGHADLLPNALDPLCNVRELNIVNSSTQTVLRAVLLNAEKGKYTVKRSLNNPGFLPAATGDLLITANPHDTQFRLQAAGLTPNTGYRLKLNDDVAAPASTSDAKGRLKLTVLPLGAPDVTDIQSVALTDATGTNIVLNTGGLGVPCTTAAQSRFVLGAAANFVVLAGSTVANTGSTIIHGDLGLSPGSAVDGFPPGTVVGMQHVTDTTAAQAKLDLTTAYNDAAGRTVAPISVAGNIGGMTLAPGLYKSTDSLEISSGDLTLDAQGDANGVFIFQIASTLTTTSGRAVILSGGAKAANVFWQVGTSATLGTTSVFKGTIMADQSITLMTGATLEGRALARIAAVTLAGNVITLPAP
jgi:hypothetical protein